MLVTNVMCLVPSTGTVKPLLRYVLDFCIREGARLNLVSVVEPAPVWPEVPFPFELHEALLASEQKRLQQLVAELGSEHGVAVSSHVLSGSDVAVILDAIAKQNCDLLVKSAEPEDWSSRLFGSLGMRLLRKCPVPVLIVQGARAQKHHRVLVAVDPMAQDASHQALNKALIAAARSLARLNDSELHVVHAWALHPQYLAGDAERLMTPAQVEQWVAAAEKAHRRAFDKLLHEVKTADDLALHEHLQEGDPASVVAHVTRAIKADVIVMGTVERSGVRGLIMGNTAEKLLHQVHCSVLALKPPGFSI